MLIQAHIPPVFAALHNFILDFNPSDIDNLPEDDENIEEIDVFMLGDLADGPPTSVEKTAAEKKRDEIAQAIWEQYQEWLNEQGVL